MKVEHITLKWLNINTLNVQPLQGCDFNFISFPPVFTGGYSNFIPSGLLISFSEWNQSYFKYLLSASI